MDRRHLDAVDRLLTGDLSAEEQRRLAQAALDDPELFETLTMSALAQESAATLSATSHTTANPRSSVDGASFRRRPRRRWVLAGAALAAAAVLVLSVSVARAPAPSTASPPTANTSSAAPSPVQRPALLVSRTAIAPQQSFRTTTSNESRDPKSEGSVTAVAGSEIQIDLGSLDGLTNGSVVEVLSSPRAENSRARITITATFRERARGRTATARAVHTGDRVVAPVADYVSALLDRAASRAATGDAANAIRLLDAAVSASNTATTGHLHRHALEQVAALKRDSGATVEAIAALRSAVDSFDLAPAATIDERATTLNELGAALIEANDYGAASGALLAADQIATGAVSMRVKNNLGALAAIRGDRDAAGNYYRTARTLAGDTSELATERETIDSNLASLDHAGR